MWFHSVLSLSLIFCKSGRAAAAALSAPLTFILADNIVKYSNICAHQYAVCSVPVVQHPRLAVLCEVVSQWMSQCAVSRACTCGDA